MMLTDMSLQNLQKSDEENLNLGVLNITETALYRMLFESSACKQAIEV